MKEITTHLLMWLAILGSFMLAMYIASFIGQLASFLVFCVGIMVLGWLLASIMES